MPNELSTFNRVMAERIIQEQTNDALLEWGLKYFEFDDRKCAQAVNFASKMGIFLFDIKNDEIAWIANGIAIYLKEIYSKDNEMQKALDKFFEEYPACAFSKLTDKSIIASLNHNQAFYADDGYRFYEYIQNNILNSKKINKDFNWENMRGVGRMKSPYTNSLSHTTWECKYHIVFAPKYKTLTELFNRL